MKKFDPSKHIQYYVFNFRDIFEATHYSLVDYDVEYLLAIMLALRMEIDRRNKGETFERYCEGNNNLKKSVRFGKYE